MPDRTPDQSTPSTQWLFRAVIGLVALAPLPLGSNRPLPAALLACATGSLLVLYAILKLRSGTTSAVPFARTRYALLLYGAVCVWILIQTLPLSFAADPIWGEASRILGLNLTGSISVNPDESLSGLMRLLTYAGIFWLTLQLSRSPERARTASASVAWIGTAYALYGLVIFLSGNEWILLSRKWAYEDSLTSTFVNRNSFATFAGLCLLCAIRPVTEQIHQMMRASLPFRIRLKRSLDSVITGMPHYLVMSLLLLSALFATASRAGVASSLVALLVLLYVGGGRRAVYSIRVLLFVALLATVAVIGLFSTGNQLAERYAAEGVSIADDSRGEIYEAVIEAIQTDPWTGTGFATFADVFPAYRHGEQIHAHVWDKAHNTYLENTLELGIPASACLIVAIGLLVWRCAVGVMTRRRDFGFSATGFAASILVAIHSLVDFSLQIPAVTVLYAFIMGFAVSQSWSMNEDER